MIHYLQYRAKVAKNQKQAILNLSKKWFEDWFNVFDLYNFADLYYQTTVNIPCVNQLFEKDVIGKFYVTGIEVEEDTIYLNIMFLQSQNKWLDKDSELLGEIMNSGKKDYLFGFNLPIATIKSECDCSQALGYVCDTFTQCINQQFNFYGD